MIYFLEYPEDVDRKKIDGKLTLQMEVQGMIDIMDEKIHWEDGVVLPNKEVATEFLKKERETYLYAVRFFIFDKNGKSKKKWLLKQTIHTSEYLLTL